MMTQRNRNILIVAGAALLLALIVGLAAWLLRPAPSGETVVETPPTADDGGLDAAAGLPSLQPSPLAPAAPDEPEDRTAALQVAELFAERYGSYSNQGDYQNLRDLLPVMTERFRRETEAFIAKGAAPAATYEGVTSIKISTRVISHDEFDGEAEMSVTLQQEKTVGASAPLAGYRTLRLNLEKVGDEWRVDSVRWEN